MLKDTYRQRCEATKQDRSPRVTHSQDLKTTIIMLEKVKPVDIYYVKETKNQGSDFTRSTLL